MYFLIEVQIFRGFNYISGIQFTPKQKINNEHSKYVEICDRAAFKLCVYTSFV